MISGSDLASHLDRFTGVRVLVVGDVMLDRFVYGAVDRLSPEAPVPVLKVDRQQAMLGGAGNVARNLATLGARVDFVTLTGADAVGDEIRALAEDLPNVTPSIIVDAERPSTLKTRYVAGAQQLLRADVEDVRPLADDRRGDIVDRARAALPGCAVLVLSDYGKGVLADDVLAALIAAATENDVPVLIDPKGRDYARYRGATLITPNRKELADATGLPTDVDDAVVEAARRLISRAGVGAVLATRGAEGMTLVVKRGKPLHAPAEAQEVFDVSGAGDTVIATVATALAAGAPLADAVRLANAAAGIVVAKAGTALVHPDDIGAALHRRDLQSGAAKLVGRDQLDARLARWRAQGLAIGFTNGCFDLLHPGHVSLLDQARAACDRLVVGLNSDASVKQLKGEDRPIQSEAARAAVLGSLAAVDLVVLFGEDTPLDLIATIKPDVLVKGADYAIDEVVGGDLVQSHGGKVVLAKLLPGQSTTATIEKLAK